MPERCADPVNHPAHYGAGRFACECIDITRHMTFLAGNAFKYVWRHAEKGGAEDLRKALVYLRWAAEEDASAVLPGREKVAFGLLVKHVVPTAHGIFAALLGILISDYATARAIMEKALAA